MVVVKKDGREKSSFRVVAVYKSNGCPTKFPQDNRYESSNPEGAIRKAFNKLCHRKGIHGKCSLYLTVENTTNGHKYKGKQYTKKCTRDKLKEPVVRFEGTPNEFLVEYGTRVHAVKSVPKKSGVKCKKSSGRMKKYSKKRGPSSKSSRSVSKKKKRRTRKKRKN